MHDPDKILPAAERTLDFGRPIDTEQFGEATHRLNEASPPNEQVTLHDQATVADLFSGLDLVPPGLARIAEWRPDSELEAASPGALCRNRTQAVKADQNGDHRSL